MSVQVTDVVRTAMVTGAASGIGFATASRLATQGYNIIAVDINAAGLERVNAQVAGQGVTCTNVAVDLSDPVALEGALSPVLRRVDLIDVLVNDAGIGYAATTTETTSEQWTATIAVNLTAVFHLCRLVLPRMLAAGRGVIVNVASAGALVGLRQRAAYCASKAGVVGLTRAIAADHAAAGIRANAICPGTVATEWIDKILQGNADPEATRKVMEQRQLDGRMGTPEEVAAGIAFLAGSEGRFVNGSVFVMDGGFTTV